LFSRGKVEVRLRENTKQIITFIFDIQSMLHERRRILNFDRMASAFVFSCYHHGFAAPLQTL
jgi:hypothetical protein